MTRRDTVARLLLSLYPSAWRREYGPELSDILTSRAITPGVIVDVVWSGLWQRVRLTKPSTILGLVSMTLILIRGVASSSPLGHQWTAVLQPVVTTFPPTWLSFVAADVYVLFMVTCGCWTYLRDPVSLNRSGTAAMRMSLIAGLPIATSALLLLFGFVKVLVIPPSRVTPVAVVMLLSPLLRLPEAWIWGIAGGWLGRMLDSRRYTLFH